MDPSSIIPPHRYYANLTEQDFVGQEGEDDLFIACARRSLDKIKEKFDNPQFVKQYNSHGYSPLHVAILSNRADVVDVIDVILDRGVGVNDVTSQEGDTGLHLVAHRGDFGSGLLVAVKLLQRGAERDIRNKKLRTPYDCALSRNFLTLAAILEGNVKVDHVIKQANKQSSRYWGERLIQGVLDSDAAVVSDCLTRGADTSLTNQNGAGAIHYLVTHSSLPVIETMAALITANCDVNLRDHEGDSALNLVIKTSKYRKSGEMTEMVTKLLQHGAKTNLRDLDGKDSLQLAGERQYADIVALLEGSSDQPERIAPLQPEPIQEPEPVPTPEPIKSPEPTTSPEPDMNQEPVTEEVREDNSEDEQLDDLPHRTQVTKPDKNGLQLIHRAMFIRSSRLRRERIESLFKLRANMNALTVKERNTPLHLAVMQNKPDTVRHLLELHVRSGIKNKDKKTPLHIAREEGYTEVKAILEEQLVRSILDDQRDRSSCAVM